MIRSYNFWLKLAGSVGLFLTAISENLGIYINVVGVKEIIMTFCGILITIGIVKKTKQEISTLQEIQDVQTENEATITKGNEEN